MRENRTYGSEGGVSRWLIPTPIAVCKPYDIGSSVPEVNAVFVNSGSGNLRYALIVIIPRVWITRIAIL